MILALNGGSSSLKYGLFAVEGDRCDTIASSSIVAGVPHEAVFEAIDAALSGAKLTAIGHRIVHGGPDLFTPVVLDADAIGRIDAARVFAPLHVPAALAMIEAATSRFPNVTQVACFDTGFHQHLPAVAAVLPLPRALRAAGVRRYGFHGLSCQSIVRQLGTDLPDRLVIAHLGSGASVTAVRAGRSIDTSMGLTPSGGVVMATRSGDVDPGLLFFLMREQDITASGLEDLLDRQSGLLGVSGVSGDLQVLRQLSSSEPDAGLAIELFCRSVAKQIAAMIVSLGGIDMLVFSGGIGEHDPETRDAIRASLVWAGLGQNETEYTGVRVMVLSPNEEEQIARDVAAIGYA